MTSLRSALKSQILVTAEKRIGQTFTFQEQQAYDATLRQARLKPEWKKHLPPMQYEDGRPATGGRYTLVGVKA